MRCWSRRIYPGDFRMLVCLLDIPENSDFLCPGTRLVLNSAPPPRARFKGVCMPPPPSKSIVGGAFVLADPHCSSTRLTPAASSPECYWD